MGVVAEAPWRGVWPVMSRGRWLWACLAVALCTAAGTVCVAVLRFQRCREAQDSAAEGDVDGPVLQIDKPAIDFGIVQPGSKLVGRFRLTNRGIGTLSLSDLRTSCGCAPAKLGKSALGPEASSKHVSRSNSGARRPRFARLPWKTAIGRSCAGNHAELAIAPPSFRWTSACPAHPATSARTSCSSTAATRNPRRS